MAGARLQRGLDRAPPRPRRRGPVPRKPPASVRRTDLVELLADVGLGSAMHSIVGQGKVEQVLASKPEDRRAFVEEAAGLGKFKRRRHRAELKLARVALQVERALDVEAEVKKRLRPLALQATAAERAEKLGAEIASLRARVAQLDLGDAASAGTRRPRAAARPPHSSRRGSQSRLEALLADRARAEDELSDAAGRREASLRRGAIPAPGRLRPPVDLRGESAAALRDRLARRARVTRRRPETGTPSTSPALERTAARDRRRRPSRRRRARRSRRAGTARSRAPALGGAGPRRAGGAPPCRAGAGGARGQARSSPELEVEAGAERAVAAPLSAAARPRCWPTIRRSRARAARAGARRGSRQPHRPGGRRTCRRSSESFRSSRAAALLDAPRALRDARGLRLRP